MPAERANLYIDQGADFVATLSLSTTASTDYEITNQQFFCDVRKPFSNTKAFSIDVSPIPGAPTNDLELFVSANTSVSVPPGKYTYDVLMINSVGLTEKILEGLVFVLPTATRIG